MHEGLIVRFRMIQEGETFSDDPDIADVKVIDGRLQVIVRRGENAREYYESQNVITPGEGQMGMTLVLIHRAERKESRAG